MKLEKIINKLDKKHGKKLTRLIDVGTSIIALPLSYVFFAPYIALKKLAKEKVHFGQIRVGQNKKSFIMYKFRSMREDAPLTYDKKVAEQYVTADGKLLRKTNADEIPNFINIFKGDMSLVGPRPVPRSCIKHKLREKFGTYDAKPGVFGFAAVYERTNKNYSNASSKDVREYMELEKANVEMMREKPFRTYVFTILYCTGKYFLGDNQWKLENLKLIPKNIAN